MVIAASQALAGFEFSQQLDWNQGEDEWLLRLLAMEFGPQRD